MLPAIMTSQVNTTSLLLAGSNASSDSNEPPNVDATNGVALKSAINGLKAEAQADSGADSTDGCAANGCPHVRPRSHESGRGGPVSTLACVPTCLPVPETVR